MLRAALGRAAAAGRRFAQGSTRPQGPPQSQLSTYADPPVVPTDARSRMEMRAKLRGEIKARMPHTDPNMPPFYAEALGGQDKVVILGKGRTWYQRSMRAETVDRIYTHASWDRLQEPMRNMKLFTKVGVFSSDVIRRLSFPDLAFVLSIAMTVTVYNTCIAPVGIVIEHLSGNKTHDFLLHSNMFCLPNEHALILGTAIGLLVTFRTTQSYLRYQEARRAWAETLALSIYLVSRIMARIPTPRANMLKKPEILAARNHGVKLAWTFPHALRYHCTFNGCNNDMENDDDQLENKRIRLRDELMMIWDFDDEGERAVAERLLHTNTRNWPLAVCQELSFLNANYYAGPHPGGLGAPNSDGVDAKIMAMQQVVADTERIIQTPIYTPYTRFTNRVIFMFICTLPPVLYPMAGPFLTAPIALYVAFVLLGIDDVGRRVEEPFDNMALWEFCEMMDKSCNQLIANSRRMEHSPRKPRETPSLFHPYSDHPDLLNVRPWQAAAAA